MRVSTLRSALGSINMGLGGYGAFGYFNPEGINILRLSVALEGDTKQFYPKGSR